jgi:hypothetical protein
LSIYGVSEGDICAEIKASVRFTATDRSKPRSSVEEVEDFVNALDKIVEEGRRLQQYLDTVNASTSLQIYENYRNFNYRN